MIPLFEKKKSLGQNFLKNPTVARDIVTAGSIIQGDTVLEIGPGVGALTTALLETGAQVIAVEADARAIEVLESTFAREITSGALRIIHGDIREITISDLNLPPTYKIVANIPYYITGQLFRMFLEAEHQPSTIVFLVQKEVAERIARSKKESLLSLSVKVYGDPTYVQTVKRGNFNPVPGVDSAILKIEHISRDRFKTFEEAWFFTLIHEGFKARRKQLFGALKGAVDPLRLKSVFMELALPLTVRGEDVSIDDWCSLAEKLADV